MYNISQGLKNIFRNIRLSLASIATVSACIFLLCLFLAVIMNLRNIVANIESEVGITVFFNEELSEEEIKSIGSEIEANANVRKVEFVSAQEAWAKFKEDYFEGREELAEGFAEDNPLKGSASYTIYLKNVESQADFVAWLEGLNGVRQVNYSSKAGSSLATINRAFTIVSMVIIGVLMIVAIILIRNTIAVSCEFRKTEIGIMRLVGATNHMIRAPFVIEGVVLGLVGAVIPLVLTYFLYNYAVDYATAHLLILSDIIEFLPIETIMPYMAVSAGALGVGLGLVVSSLTIIKYLRV